MGKGRGGDASNSRHAEILVGNDQWAEPGADENSLA